jgi:GT2 family glycosyltransferase
MDICPSKGEATAAAIISRRCHVFVSVTARTPALRAVAFDESLRRCEDFDCWIRFTAAGYRIGYHRKVLVLYRKHGANNSASATQCAEYGIQVLTNSLALWPQGSEEVRLLLEAKAKGVAELETIRGKQALLNQDVPAAVAHLQAANTYYKSVKKSTVIFLLKLAPRLVGAVFRLRRLFFRAYRDE